MIFLLNQSQFVLNKLLFFVWCRQRREQRISFRRTPFWGNPLISHCVSVYIVSGTPCSNPGPRSRWPHVVRATTCNFWSLPFPLSLLGLDLCRPSCQQMRSCPSRSPLPLNKTLQSPQ